MSVLIATGESSELMGVVSWGERSCSQEKAPKNEHGGCSYCTMGTCNVDCKYYTWDGKTKPDSEKRSFDSIDNTPGQPVSKPPSKYQKLVARKRCEWIKKTDGDGFEWIVGVKRLSNGKEVFFNKEY